MHQETQSELFIRTLSDLLSDLRFQRHTRQRDRYKAEADQFMTRYGVFRTRAKPFDYPSLTRSQAPAP